MPLALRHRGWLLLAASIALQLVLYRSAAALRPDAGHVQRLARRGEPLEDDNPSVFDFPYLEWYNSATPLAKPFVFAGLVGILSFLFSFIGISASDFFCPNLATIASSLGLSESTAGVTFLAFGNGSPDVFSTFAALNGGTFGLAVGELLGAATFIVSVIVGSIALIRPFDVPRYAFMRDTIFFTAAVILLILVLHDGHLSIYESGGMILLYVAYVGTVVGGTYFQASRKAKSSKAVTPTAAAAAPISPQMERLQAPHGSPESTRHPSPTDTPLPSPLVTGAPRRLPLDSEPFPLQRANFSLLGAIEFRDVVNSLRKDASRTPSPQRSPLPREGREGREGGDYFGAWGGLSSHRRSVSVQEWTLASALEANAGVAVAAAPEAVKEGRRRSVSHAPMPRQTSVGGARMARQLGLTPVLDSPPAEFRDAFRAPAASSPAQPSPSPARQTHLAPPEENPWEGQVGTPMKPASPLRLHIPDPPVPAIPTIHIIDPTGHDEVPMTTPPADAPAESRFRVRHRMRAVVRTLFPSLQCFRQKSPIGMLVGVWSVPAVLALTLTLPVVDRVDEGRVQLPTTADEGLAPSPESGAGIDRDVSPAVGEELHHLVETGFSSLHSPLARLKEHRRLRRASEADRMSMSDVSDVASSISALELDDEMYEEEGEVGRFRMGLTAAQCVLGPVFCVAFIFGDLDIMPYLVLGTAAFGALAGGAVLRFSTDGTDPGWRLVRCFCGFVCAMVWIAAIANEVVSVLLAIGEIMGLSEAIIGLTIFAIGNSLADLVANVTVAQFAPTMAYAACFGGPMLNLLLGIGGAGTYGILVTRTPVAIHFSPTLWVSASGLVLMLLATAVVVPLNGYRVDRRWAACLITGYGVLMGCNVLVELMVGKD